jgi:hypothetical protein
MNISLGIKTVGTWEEPQLPGTPSVCTGIALPLPLLRYVKYVQTSNGSTKDLFINIIQPYVKRCFVKIEFRG